MIPVGFDSDEIAGNRFSYCVYTNMKCISGGCTLDKLIPPWSVSGGPQDSLDAPGLTSRPPAFSAIRSRTEGGPADGGVKRILGSILGQKGLCVSGNSRPEKQVVCITSSCCVWQQKNMKIVFCIRKYLLNSSGKYPI